MILNFCFIIANSQSLENIKNTSIKGIQDWEKIISETTLDGVYNIERDNSFVKYFKIKNVEKIEIKFNNKINPDTSHIYLLQYDTLGLLLTEKTKYFKNNYCFTTYYKYDSNEFLIGKKTTFCAIIDGIGSSYLLPNVIKSYFKNSLLQRKEFLLADKRSPFKVYYYYYNNDKLLEKIEIKEDYLKTPTIVLFKYSYY